MGLETPKEIPQNVIDNYFTMVEKGASKNLGFEDDILKTFVETVK